MTTFPIKHIPKNFDELIFNDIQKLKDEIIDNDNPNNILLYSKQGGTGKDSTFNVVANYYTSTIYGIPEKLEIYCAKDKGIDNIKANEDKLKNVPVGTKKRVVFLNEVDGLSPQSMQSLKNILDIYTKHNLFVLATNEIDKIPQPIQSRCVKFDLSKPNKKLILKRLKNICNENSIKFREENLMEIINDKKIYPCIREMVQYIGTNRNNLNKIKNEKKIDYGSWFWKNYIMKQNYIGLKKYIVKKHISYYEALEKINVPARISKNGGNELLKLINLYKKKMNGTYEDEKLFDEFLIKFAKIVDKK